MSWRQKFTGNTQKIEGKQISFPIQFDLIPEKLSARVYLNEINSRNGAVPCWTYITKGLMSHQQKELIFSLRRNPDEKMTDFPRAPLEFFTNVYRLAEQGQLVDVGDITEMASANFLGYSGLLYILPEVSQNIDGLAPALAAIMLTEEELIAVKEFGPMRVMARLGYAYRHYPCPTWSDRKRSSLTFAKSMHESVLAKVPHLWMRGITVWMDNNLITLRLLPQTGELLHHQLSQMPLNTPLALLSNFDLASHGCLVWETGQSQPSAITPSDEGGSRFCGCFILFVPGQSQDDGKLIEDGFGVMLTNTSWAAIKNAIALGQPVSIPAAQTGMSFQLEWTQSDYYNPVEGVVYHSDSWETYKPKNSPSQEIVGGIHVKNIVLLTSQLELENRVGVEALSTYIKAVEKNVRDYFASSPQAKAQDLIVQCEIWSDGKVNIGYASQPGIANEVLKDLHTSLLTLPIPTVSSDSIKFQIVFAIESGSAIL
jgi:Smad anchor for receptor activation-like, C-terminal